MPVPMPVPINATRRTLPANGHPAVLALVLVLALALAILAAWNSAYAANAVFTPPALTGRVTDEAHVLPREEAARLEAALAAHEAKTTEQVVVATVPSLQGLGIEEYANRLFRAWGLGQKDKNNGVLLLVAPNEREVRIEVGYGLEGALTDALSSRIIHEIMLPAFRSGDMPGGVEAGTLAVLKVLDGGALPGAQPAREDSWEPLIVFGLFLALWLIGIYFGRRGGGRFGPGGFGGGGFGGRGGGGFGGGGGSSGGGGASGRW